MAIEFPELDPDELDFRVMVWCSRDGTNDGTVNDTGELQGATISTLTATAVDSSITVSSSNKDEITWRGVTFAADTAATVWITGGTIGITGKVLVVVVTSDGRALEETMHIPIRAD